MKKNIFDQFARSFARTLADVPWFAPTLSAVLVATLINVLTDTLSTFGGPLWGWVFITILILLTVGFVYSYNRRYQHWIRNLGPIAEIAHPEPREGLVFIFSNEQTLSEALRYHAPTLRHCWLLVTPEYQSKAGAFIHEYTGVTFSVLPVKSLYDTQACYNLVRDIYKSNGAGTGIPAHEIISDITGGTKPLSMGMVLACLEGGYAIEHVPTKFDSTGNPIVPLPPIQLVVKRGQ